MAQATMLRARSTGYPENYDDAVDEAVLSRIEGTVAARSLWADAVATTVTIGGGALHTSTLIRTSGATRVTISTTQVLVENADITCPGAGAGSERFGAGAVAAGVDGTALGRGASAASADAVAVGRAAAVSATGSGVAIGTISVVGAGATAGVAVGNGALVGAANSTVIGDAATDTSGNDSVTIGTSAQGGVGSVVVGAAAAAGAASQVVVGSGAIGGSGTGSIAIGLDSFTGVGTDSIAIGRLSLVEATDAIGIGRGATVGAGAAAADSIAIGRAASVNATGQGVLIGAGSSLLAGATDNVVIGTGVTGRSTFCVLIGDGVVGSVGASEMVLVGAAASSAAGSTQGVAVGRSASAGNSTGGIALGYQAAIDAGHSFSIAIGYQALTTSSNQCIVGSSTGPILDLILGEGDTDATPPGTVTVRVTNASAGSGANGTILDLRSGDGDGGGNDGNLTIRTGVVERARFLGTTGYLGVNTVAPASFVDSDGSVGLGNIQTITSAASPFTADDTDHSILADASGGAITINLPAVAAIGRRRYWIIKTDSSVNTVTIDASGAETINGSLTKVLAIQYDAVELVTDGTAWYIR